MKYGKKRSAFLLAAVLMLTGLQMSGVTVKATAATPAVYTAEIKEDQTITAGQTVNLTVEMASGTETTYNSLNMVVSYDSNYLTFVKESSTGVAGCSFTETTSGVVDVARYGAAISLTTDKQVCKLANQAVWDNIPVEILYPTKEELASMDYRSKIEIEGQVRIVRIGDVDMCACCAPHVSRTGEVGMIKVISCDRHRGGCRMTIQCGDRALEDYRKKQEGVTAVSVALSAPPEKVGDAVLHMKEQMDQIRMKLNQMQASYLAGKLEEIKADDKFVCLFEEELDNIAVRNFVNDACERCQGICAAFVGTDEDGYRYIIGSSSTDVREFAKKLNEAFSGKGGGKPEMVQGSLKGSRSDIEKLFA